MSRTQDALQQAKDALLRALRVAEQENTSATVRRQIEALTGRAEALQCKLKAAAK